MGGAVDMRTSYTERTQARLGFLRRRVRTRRMVRQWLLAGGALAAGALTTATVAIAVFDIDVGGAGSAGGSEGCAEGPSYPAHEPEPVLEVSCSMRGVCTCLVLFGFCG